MDPDKLWEDIVGLADELQQLEGRHDGSRRSLLGMASIGGELAEKVRDFRDWLSSGGFVPKGMTVGHDGMSSREGFEG